MGVYLSLQGAREHCATKVKVTRLFSKEQSSLVLQGPSCNNSHDKTSPSKCPFRSWKIFHILYALHGNPVKCHRDGTQSGSYIRNEKISTYTRAYYTTNKNDRIRTRGQFNPMGHFCVTQLYHIAVMQWERLSLSHLL